MPQSEYDTLLEPSPTQPKSEYDALLEPTPQTPQVEQPSAHPILSGIAAGLWRAVPKSLGEVAGFIGAGGKSDIQQLLQTGHMIRDVATGASPEEAVRKEAPEVAQQQDVLLGKYGTREQAAGITGLGVQAAMLTLPFLKDVRAKIPSLRETVFGKTEEPLAAEVAATKEVIKNASEIPSAERVPSAQVRPGVDEKAPLRQQGQAPEVREKAQVGTQVMPVPQPEQPRIISTAVKSGDTVLRGESLNESHDAIGERAGIAKPTEEQRGFTIQNPDGTTREVFGAEGRKEAATVANAAGQVKPENAGTTELHSQQLAAAVSGTEMPPAAVPKSSVIRGQQVSTGDDVHWMSGGTWDGKVQDIVKKPSGTHDVTVKATTGEIFTLQDAEHYGINVGRSKFITAENKPSYQGWEKDYPDLVPKPQIPEGAKATVKLRTETGEMAEATMDAKQAEGIFTKEKSSYQALLNCLGA